MNQTLLFNNKHIISIIIHLLHNNFVPVCNIILWEEIIKILWICVPCTFFSGQKSDTIYLVFLTLGDIVVLFSSEGSDISETDPLS